MEKKRIRDFGIVPGRVKTGKRNTITDVPGVLVGHCTVNTEENHTGVTVIIPGPDNAFANHYTAAAAKACRTSFSPTARFWIWLIRQSLHSPTTGLMLMGSSPSF